MKKLFLTLSRIAMMFAVIAMVACNDAPVNNGPEPTPEPEPEPKPELEFKMEAELIKAGTSTAEIKLTTLNIGQYAYSVDVVGSNKELVPEMIFALGTAYDCKDGDNTVVVEELKPATSYVVTIAGATVEDEFYEKTVKVEFTTAEFSDEITFFDVDYMSVSAHFNYPTDKVQEGNVLKWAIAEFPLYYQNNIEQSDAEMLNRNDTAYPIILRESTSWKFCDENSVITDPSTGETYDFYSPIVPGQPMYFFVGEFAYDTTDHWGWGDGYYAPLFDLDNYWRDYAASGYTKLPNQEEYWSGYYRKEYFESKAPSKMSAKPEVKMDLTPRGGKITITPTEGIYGFCFAIMEPSLQMQVLPLLNNQTKYMQWFITSFYAFMNSLSLTGFGPTEINLEDLYYDGMKQKTEYTLHITSLGDQMGSKQSYTTHKFILPEPKKPKSKVTIKGIDNPEGENQWNKAWFNIKCESGDAWKIKWIAHYEREWMSMFNQYTKYGYSEEEAMDMVISQYGVSFTDEEVAAINSAEGYNISFDSRADATTFLAVRVLNDENSISYAKGEVRTVKEPFATPVNSPLFEELKGEWTATTTLYYQHYHYCKDPQDKNHDCGKDKTGIDGYEISRLDDDEYNYIVKAYETFTSDVTIGEIGYEQTLPEEIYQLFFNSTTLKTKEQVDAVYNQFKTTVDDFNANVRGQNRILCQGFEFEYDSDKVTCKIPEHNDKPDGMIETQFASPYDLFIADEKTYSAYNYESPVFDFGPKWFLEIAADGTVTAPFNTNYFTPMAQWLNNVYYFLGVSNSASLPYVRDTEGNIVNGHFPVTISEDKNTITIHPLTHTYSTTDENGITITKTEDFYPNLGRSYNGQFQFYSRVVAPIVLTRKGTAAAQNAKAAAATATATAAQTKGEIKSIYEVKTATAPKSRTALPATNEKIVAPTKVDYKILSAEEFKANCQATSEKRFGRN